MTSLYKTFPYLHFIYPDSNYIMQIVHLYCSFLLTILIYLLQPLLCQHWDEYSMQKHLAHCTLLIFPFHQSLLCIPNFSPLQNIYYIFSFPTTTILSSTILSSCKQILQSDHPFQELLSICIYFQHTPTCIIEPAHCHSYLRFPLILLIPQYYLYYKNHGNFHSISPGLTITTITSSHLKQCPFHENIK